MACMARLTTSQIDKVLEHLPVLKNPDLVVSNGMPIEQQGEVLKIGGEERSPEINRLVEDLNDNGFVVGFDWGRWQEQAAMYLREPERLQCATLAALQKLVTTHVRKDRFCEGHFSEMVRCGHITAILERLAEIRATQHGTVTTQVENPWADLPSKPPFVLPQDKELIERFNRAAEDRHRVRLEILPEPYLGSPDAPVVLLSLNPGFKKWNIKQHRNARFAKLSRANLLHRPAEYPFYLLDPRIDRTTYWERKLGRLIKQLGCAKSVARNVLCVELFPYHSKKFRHSRLDMPSQQYSCSLVRRAIQRRAVILILRGRKHWWRSIPELETYRNRYVGNSPQAAAVSPGNLPKGFAAAVRAIRRAEGRV
jgi:hypothetical protein